jgi:hypothetical protein
MVWNGANYPQEYERTSGTMTREQFVRWYEDWGVDRQHDAILEAATVEVPGERVIVVGFPLGDGIEWTLRLDSDRPSFGPDVVVI